MTTAAHIIESSDGPFCYYAADIAQKYTRHEELSQLYSDLHKDAYGVRARLQWDAYSEAELEEMIDALGPVIDATINEERAAQEAAAVRFEARVADTIAAGARDRETALRWVDQAEGADGDREFLCYLCGLRYGYFNA
ncbi:MAG TPA: hypothetical protein VF681_14625 [Abditibacteriaceae bacterium]|jgi:hypothetical protein